VLFNVVLNAHPVVDGVGALSAIDDRGSGYHQARLATHGITEPVIDPRSGGS
jgi:hypothetical protein